MKKNNFEFFCISFYELQKRVSILAIELCYSSLYQSFNDYVEDKSLWSFDINVEDNYNSFVGTKMKDMLYLI